MKIKLASSSIWHDKFLEPLANGLTARGYDTELILGTDKFGECKDCITITSYHEDLKALRGSKKIIFLEHAVSHIKSAYAHVVMPLADYILVQGEVFSEWLKFCYPDIKQLKTGWHPIENLYNKKSTKDMIVKRHDLNPSKPIILYLPTWDSPAKRKNCGTFEEAFPIIDSLPFENILTVPHKSCVYANNTHLDNPRKLKNANTYEYLLACDLIIGDTSSILVESTVLNKPIIQLNKWADLEGFISWYNKVDERSERIKNLFSLYIMGDVVTLNKDLITKTIEENLENPDKYKYLRNHYKNISFYNLGNSLNITLDSIEQIIRFEKENG